MSTGRSSFHKTMASSRTDSPYEQEGAQTRKFLRPLCPSRAIAVGLMSGTSHDGISAAAVEFRESPRDARLRFRLLAFLTKSFTRGLRERLLKVAEGEAVSAGELSTLNFELGRSFAEAARAVIAKAGIAAADVTLIGSHGHTVFHRPPRTAAPGEQPSTMQIGEPAVIAACLGVPVVADFRPADVALGGEGAPLAPLAHLRLFGDSRRGRAIQNIGGIGNVTYLPPGAAYGDRRLLAFDTGPGNMLIDALVRHLTDNRQTMDRNGRIAAQGQVNKALLALLLEHPFFHRSPPKSTGREEFGKPFLAAFLREAKRLGVEGADLIATATALTAESIAFSARKFLAPNGPLDELVVAGGGAKNRTMMKMIEQALPEVKVVPLDSLGLSGEALEAVAFALLGYETLRGRPGNLPNVTGARRPAILGKILFPPL